MEQAEAVAEEPTLRAPTGTVPDWYERIEKAKAARQLGIQLQAAHKTKPQPEPRQQPMWQWHAEDA